MAKFANVVAAVCCTAMYSSVRASTTPRGRNELVAATSPHTRSRSISCLVAPVRWLGDIHPSRRVGFRQGGLEGLELGLP